MYMTKSGYCSVLMCHNAFPLPVLHWPQPCVLNPVTVSCLLPTLDSAVGGSSFNCLRERERWGWHSVCVCVEGGCGKSMID